MHYRLIGTLARSSLGIVSERLVDRGPVEQRSARVPVKDEVAGSNPVGAATAIVLSAHKFCYPRLTRSLCCPRVYAFRCSPRSSLKGQATGYAKGALARKRNWLAVLGRHDAVGPQFVGQLVGLRQ